MGYAYALIYGAAAIAGVSLLSAVVRAYLARVAADGGTTVDAAHAQEVYADTIGDEPTLIQSCDSGKAGTLYSLLVNPPQTLLETYTGSAAAYSLRSLSSSTTNVVKVRRSGDDAELDFTASEVSGGTLAAWVVAGGGTEDGFVTTWYDQSGNTNNATQATAASQPKIVSSGTLVTENGKAAVDFDGSSDKMSFSEISGVSGMTLISVNKYDAINSSGTIYASSATILAYTAGFIKDLAIGGRNSAAELYYETDPTNQVLSGASISTGNQYLQLAYVSTSGSGISTNGSLTTGSAGLNTGIVRAIAQDSASVYFNGTIQEIIIYDSDQSANRTGIEANINAHYNIYT